MNTVIVLDEFDRLPSGEKITRLIADTIKSLSDYDVSATIIVVGVGDSVSELVKGHESVVRHVIEVPMPRMSRQEQSDIITTRIPELDLTIDEGPLGVIINLARGLPYYAHLIGQKACVSAITSEHDKIESNDVRQAMVAAIDESEIAMRTVYYNATKSPQKHNLYRQTLAACALARSDEFGYFCASDVRQPLSAILGRSCDIPAFNDRLRELSGEDRGTILQRVGEKGARRYRFADPLMEPFVIIKSIVDDVISLDSLIPNQPTTAPLPPE